MKNILCFSVFASEIAQAILIIERHRAEAAATIHRKLAELLCWWSNVIDLPTLHTHTISLTVVSSRRASSPSRVLHLARTRFFEFGFGVIFRPRPFPPPSPSRSERKLFVDSSIAFEKERRKSFSHFVGSKLWLQSKTKPKFNQNSLKKRCFLKVSLSKSWSRNVKKSRTLSARQTSDTLIAVAWPPWKMLTDCALFFPWDCSWSSSSSTTTFDSSTWVLFVSTYLSQVKPSHQLCTNSDHSIDHNYPLARFHRPLVVAASLSNISHTHPRQRQPGRRDGDYMAGEEPRATNDNTSPIQRQSIGMIYRQSVGFVCVWELLVRAIVLEVKCALQSRFQPFTTIHPSL